MMQNTETQTTDRCPGCGSVNLSDEHLMYEYLDLQKHSFNRMFGHNARKAQDEVARILLGRGVVEIPNIFGAIPIRIYG